jgi:hypothetical protein
MLMKELEKKLSLNIPTCTSCRKRPAEIRMHGYTEVDPFHLCDDCALLLARALLEDLCDLRTLNGRNG